MSRTLPTAAPPPTIPVRACARSADGQVPDWLGPPAPHWDGRRLWLGDRVLAVFGPADRSVSAVLAAFEAGCRWADGRVPDPLPARPGEDPDAARARAAAAVGELNRRLPPGTLRFEALGDTVLCDAVGPDGREIDAGDTPEPAAARPGKTNAKNLMGWGYHGRPVGAI